MRFSFTEQQDALRREIKEFLGKEWNEEALREAEQAGDLASGHSPGFYKKLADKGWLALNWPKEYGGKGWTPLEMAIFSEETGYHAVPMDAFSVTSIVGNAIVNMGSEEQKKEFLPKVAAGELMFCIGYTEPNAGSDLASLETKAVADGDHYVVNGVKVFNTGGHVADWVWLATRTDPAAVKHRGITVFLVNLRSPGISIRPLYNVADGYQQNELVFQDVRVPKENMVGEKNRGWYVIAKALDIERVNVSGIGDARRTLEELGQFCKETKRNGVPLSKDPVIRQHLVELSTEVEVARLLTYKVIWMQTSGQIPDVAASMAKLYGSELEQKIAHLGMKLIGLHGIVHGSSKYAAMRGRLELMVRSTMPATVAGGSSQIQREVIAHRGLDLPRS